VNWGWLMDINYSVLVMSIDVEYLIYRLIFLCLLCWLTLNSGYARSIFQDVNRAAVDARSCFFKRKTLKEKNIFKLFFALYCPLDAIFTFPFTRKTFQLRLTSTNWRNAILDWKLTLIFYPYLRRTLSNKM
jgi:hypothetical protein